MQSLHDWLEKEGLQDLVEWAQTEGNNQAVPLEPFMVRHLCQECEFLEKHGPVLAYCLSW